MPSNKLNKSERAAEKAAKAGSADKVEITHVPTSLEVADKVFSSESSSVIDAVKDTIGVIVEAKNAIVENTLAIGDRLLKLRTEIGSDHFGKFTSEVAPTLGISKSNCYKLMANADVLRKAIPSPSVRSFLMTNTDGRGIVSYQQEKDGKQVYTPALTPSAEAALKQVGNPPKSEDESAVHDWGTAFLKSLRKQRNTERKGSSITKDRTRLYSMLLRYGQRHGTKHLELFITAADALLTAMDSESDLPKYFETAIIAARKGKAVASTSAKETKETKPADTKHVAA